MINVLPIAMSATACLGCNQSFQYIETTGVKINKLGIEEPDNQVIHNYFGSVQAVDNKLYTQLNLDLTKNYKTIFCPDFVASLAEKEVTGKVKYNGKYYDVISNQNWFEQNGYTQCIICETKALNGEFYGVKN